MAANKDLFKMFDDLSKEMEDTYTRGWKNIIYNEGDDLSDFDNTFKELFDDITDMAADIEEHKAPSSRLEVESIMMRGMNLYPKAQLHVDITKEGIRLMHNWTIMRSWDHVRRGIIDLFFEDSEHIYLTSDEKELMTEYFRSYRAK